MYTVKQLAELAGISVRTLHYYDEIDLLNPSSLGENGYRYYDDTAVFRLQQILLFREMDLSLKEIKAIIDTPDFDLITALREHRTALQNRAEQLNTLIKTVDTTIAHLAGEVNMSKKKVFEGFTEEKQKEYEKEAMERYGEDRVKETMKRWNAYSKEEQERIKQEGSDIYTGIAGNMEKGHDSDEVQGLLAQWHQHIRYFYEPTIEILGGLGNLYYDSPDFNATFTAIDPDLPAFLQKAIAYYVDILETKWLEKELGIEVLEE